MVQKYCTSCGAELIPGNIYCPKCLIRVPVEQEKHYPKDTPENRARKMREFKVTVYEEVWDLGSRGKYNTQKVEDFLNTFGRDGWSLKKIVSRTVPGLAFNTIQFIIFLERDMPLGV